MAQPTSPQMYGVVIYRKDEKHIVVVESEDFDKCYKHWELLQDQWAVASKELKPFVLKSPEVTAFEPGLIFEISLKPKQMLSQVMEETNNPYKKQMQEKGLTQTLKNYSNGIDLLDQGFNY